MKKLIAQVLKFGVVGGTAFLIDYSIMIALTEFFGINYLISSGISFVVSVIYNYILSVHWVFDVDKNGNKKKEFVVFILLSVIGLGLNQLLMWIFVSKVHVFYMLSKIFVTAIVMIYNFVTRKFFLEK
nr:GtrA family protein [uncultured Mediterraneibacter sp.]